MHANLNLAIAMHMYNVLITEQHEIVIVQSIKFIIYITSQSYQVAC